MTLNPNIIEIEPVSIWTPTGTQIFSLFIVNQVMYSPNGTATASCSFLTTLPQPNMPPVSNQSFPVYADAEQCAAWTNDASFYRVLAENAGLTPVEPSN